VNEVRHCERIGATAALGAVAIHHLRRRGDEKKRKRAERRKEKRK
jgi:hypothetical protein